MSNNSSGGGVGAGFLLFLVFLVLKLTGVIAWSWWWVTCPLWIGFVIALVILFGAAILACVAAVFIAIVESLGK